MFTGLIADVGVVERVECAAVTDLWIRTALPVPEFKQGESIAVDGACLTVVETRGRSFRVQAAPETLRRTTLGGHRAGTRVHLERALALSDRLGGHLVQGHVDATARIESAGADGGSWRLCIELPQTLAPFFIEKGSVAVDGVSLTVNTVQDRSFDVQLIPETRERTTLGQKAVGALVNLEADLVGKYVARQVALRGARGVTAEAVRAAGFGQGIG